tara:strand:- start:7374 stop:8144 length:771 start_codon:yes stop_codon:yes gene_type:complete
MKDRWWTADSLKSFYDKFEAADESHFDKLDTDYDAGSYRRMRLGDSISGSKIVNHNDPLPAYKVKFCKAIIDHNLPKRILDVGCGLGFTTQQIKIRYPRAKVIGIDVSNDAVEFGRGKFKTCEFITQAIDPSDPLKALDLDIIFAFEFYPFTRTSDFQVHKSYVDLFMSALNPRGELAIFQRWDNPSSLSQNIDLLKKTYPSHQISVFEMPIRRIGLVIPFYELSLLVTWIARKSLKLFRIKDASVNKLIIVRKPN